MMFRLRNPRRTPGQMNRTEAAWRDNLELQKAGGSIVWYGYEAMTLKLAHDCRYTPDFIVVTNDGEVQAHEVKGFWRDDARVKVKVAAEKFSWIKFVCVTKGKGRWGVEEITA